MIKQKVWHFFLGHGLPWLIVGILLATTWTAVGDVGASSLLKPLFAPGPPPQMISYQGIVKVGGAPLNGPGNFKFAIVDALGTTTYWSNDGNDPPTTAVTLPVSDGLFNVLLGDGMDAIDHTVFAETDTFLRVWFDDGGGFQLLSPDQRLVSVPYALRASYAENSLGSLNCTTDQIAKWNGSNWVCVDTVGQPALVTFQPPIFSSSLQGSWITAFSFDITTNSDNSIVSCTLNAHHRNNGSLVDFQMHFAYDGTPFYSNNFGILYSSSSSTWDDMSFTQKTIIPSAGIHTISVLHNSSGQVFVNAPLIQCLIF